MPHPTTYTPKTKLGKWVDARMPLPRLLHNSFVSYRVPRNLNYSYAFGGVLAAMLIIQIISGISLAMHYTPEMSFAFLSVEKIMRDVHSGWLLRYIHNNGASFFFIAMYIHILRGLYYGSYRAPRELLWLLGCIIYFLTITTSFIGCLLPLGQMGGWGTTVATSFFGNTMQTIILGGFAIDNSTLSRFFALHYLLPFIIVAIVIFHIWSLHIVGQTNPTGKEIKSVKDTLPFTPYLTIKNSFVVILFLTVFVWFIFFIPNHLENPENYIPFNDLKTPHNVVPKWYFLPFFSMLRVVTVNIGPIHSKLFGIAIMLSSILILFFMPWLERSKIHYASRPLFKIFFLLFLANIFFLGWLGLKPAEGLFMLMTQISTLFYFSFFLLIMPYLSKIEALYTATKKIVWKHFLHRNKKKKE